MLVCTTLISATTESAFMELICFDLFYCEHPSLGDLLLEKKISLVLPAEMR
jgi:hypothetical protein